MIEAARPNRALSGLKAYDPGHDLVALRALAGAHKLLELGSNENPFGPSPDALDAARASLQLAHIYPDPGGRALKRALAAHYRLDAAHITLGNGSHELLMLIAQAFVDPADEVLYAQFGFAVFALAAQAANAKARVIPALALDAEQPRGHDLAAMLAAIGPATRLVYLANPNNPTGTYFTQAALKGFLEQVPSRTLVVLDEAYFEYADAAKVADARALLEEFPNLIVTRTFSKGHGLAGLRVGYALAHADVGATMERLRESFNVNGVALAAAQAALADCAWMHNSVRDCVEQRELLAQGLRDLELLVTPSQTNFLLVDFRQPAATIEANLLARGVIVRPMGGYGLPNCLRVSVGLAADNARLIAVLRDILNEGRA